MGENVGKYRESSHEERELKSQYIGSNEGAKVDAPKPVIVPVEWITVDVFRDYPEHKASVAAAEKKYFADKLKLHLSEDDENN